MKTKVQHFFSKRLFILAWLSIAAFLLSQLFGRIVWQLELFSHYTPHIAAVVLLSGLCYPAARRQAIRWFFFTVGGVLMLWSMAPFYLYRQWLAPAVSINAKAPMTIGYQNVRLDNPTPSAAIAQLVNNHPDIIVVIEAGGRKWNQALATLQHEYPVHCGETTKSFFAIQAFAKNPQTQCEVLRIAGYPTIKMTYPDGRVIYGIHPLLAKQPLSIIVGDMNLSAFSPLYRDFTADSRLQRATLNGLPTWLPFAIGIDQLLTTEAPAKLSVKPLRWQGSDHRGFWVHWSL